MRRLPIAVELYVIGVILSGGLVLGLFLPAMAHAEWEEMALALAAAGALVVAGTYRIPLSHGKAVTVSVGISFATILLLGPAIATWTTAVGMAVASGYLSFYRKRWRWYTGAFNVGAYILATAGAGLVYETVGGNSHALLLSAQNMIALFTAGTAYFLINTVLVAIVTALRRQRSPWHTWLSMFEEGVAEYFTLILLAILMAVIASYRTWALLLIIPPIIVVYHSLKTSQELRAQTIDALRALADIVDSRDPYTFEHSRRVAEYVEGIAGELGLSREETETISLSARVHDLGKVGIQDAVLHKPGKYSAEERLTMQRHVRIGANIVQRFPRYKHGRDIILYHHEHYDGQGYPEGLRGDEIPLGARILAVADAYDAMTTDRPYRKALSHAAAVGELKQHSGTQFDPVVVGAFLKYLDRTGIRIRPEDGVPKALEVNA